jgi:hypothetical protein
MSDEHLNRIEGKIDQLTFCLKGLERIERNVEEIKWMMKSSIQTQSAINGKLSSREADHQQRMGTLRRRRS